MDAIPQVTLPEGRLGPWSVQRFTIEPKDSHRFFRERYFRAGTYTKLTHDREGLWMSDTPAERIDHLDFVRNARGAVLISGLGLGMCIGAALAKPGVSHVTVIEIDPDIISLVGPHYACDRLTIIQGDIISWRPPKDAHYGAVWHDIWKDVSTDDLALMSRLTRRYAQKSDWVGCWGRSLIRRGRR